MWEISRQPPRRHVPAKMPSSASSGSSIATRHTLPPDHPVYRSMAKRGSIFYRPPRRQPTHVSADADKENAGKPPPPSSSSLQTDDETRRCSQVSAESDVLFDGGCLIDTEIFEDDELFDATPEVPPIEYCKELPFWSCHLTLDTNEFLYSDVPAGEMRPCTQPAEKELFSPEEQFYPATPAIIDSIVEELSLIFAITQSHSDVPLDRRLPDLHTFIWQAVDVMDVDMWTVIPCLLLVRRFKQIHGYDCPGHYDSAHTLFLGVFMLATTVSLKKNDVENFSVARMSQLIKSPYKTTDFVRFRRDACESLNYKVWVCRDDIQKFGQDNLNDIYQLPEAHTYFLERQRVRAHAEEQERLRLEQQMKIKSNLERFMYRTPHDSLGSWNTKTMYSTEKRFLFRHLPWFPGAVTPISITAHDEIAKNYTRDGQIVTVPFLKTRTAAHT
ncbi:hypothetical protein FBU59_002089 [Linderina macrospora]|uniref:Uncharacterized protein n=1 Tax=Linderina macrospora TaxID=4868 RepID=A0ACC1JCE8_9FUNG|nr:hypothetical protein FBU59_002089 [Linderina macrospora]